MSTAGDRHYNALDTAFVVRALAALATDTTSPGSFVSTPVEQLEAAWTQLERGVNHTITLLKDEVGLDNSGVLPSANALVPLVFYLGTRPDVPLTEAERKTLIYWLLVSFIQSRYSASAATVIAQDVTALRADDPLRALCAGLGLLESRPEITAASLAGKGSTSPFFLLSYLAARAHDARDWWYGSPVALSHDGTYKVEYHHIHPQARLKAAYSKAEINDYLAFDAEVDVVTVPIGPLDVSGTVDEWRRILKRELEELTALDELSIVERPPWEGPRQPLHLLDSE